MKSKLFIISKGGNFEGESKKIKEEIQSLEKNETLIETEE